VKTIQVTDEMYEALIGISEEMNSQDNRGTGDPYFYQIQTQVERSVPDGEGERVVWFKDDFEAFNAKDMFISLKENEGISEDEAITAYEKMDQWEAADFLEENDCYKVDVRDFDKLENFFFTKSACNRHITQNHYHYRNPVDYVSHGFRNPELELVIRFLKGLTKPEGGE
jgi:hypothetical protein